MNPKSRVSLMPAWLDCVRRCLELALERFGSRIGTGEIGGLYGVLVTVPLRMTLDSLGIGFIGVGAVTASHVGRNPLLLPMLQTRSHANRIPRPARCYRHLCLGRL